MNKAIKISFSILVAMISSFAWTQEASNATLNASFKNIEASIEQSALILRINTPPRNVVSKKTLNEINSGLDIALNNKQIGTIIITGSDTLFSAGAGGDSLQKGSEKEVSHAYIARTLFHRIESFPKPIIAVIKGLSAGGGNELALACDIRIAGESAKFRQHEIQAGLIPGFGGMQRLQRIIGSGRAMEMMLTGRVIDSKEALSMGLVSAVFSDSEVLSEAISLAKTLNENLDKHALAVFKKRMAESYDESYRTALRNDQQAFDQIAVSEEAHAAIKRFIEKQKQKK